MRYNTDTSTAFPLLKISLRKKRKLKEILCSVLSKLQSCWRRYIGVIIPKRVVAALVIATANLDLCDKTRQSYMNDGKIVHYRLECMKIYWRRLLQIYMSGISTNIRFCQDVEGTWNLD